MSNKDDGAKLYASVKMAVYEVLYLVIRTARNSTSALATYIRGDVKKFQSIFSCVCYKEEEVESYVSVLKRH
jgi:hypothetical protein